MDTCSGSQDPCLIAENGKYRNIFFDRDEVTVGRSLETTVCLPSAVISRNHATIKKHGHHWFITDNASLNGIFVNDSKLVPAERRILSDGDRVSFGMKRGDEDFVYTFRNRAERALKRKDFVKDNKQSVLTKKTKLSPQIQEIMDKKNALEKKLNRMETWIAERVKVEKSLEEEIVNEQYTNHLMYQRMTDILDIVNYKYEQDDFKKSLLQARVNLHHGEWRDEKRQVELMLSTGNIEESKYRTLVSRKHILDKLISTSNVELELLEDTMSASKPVVSPEVVKQELLQDFNNLIETELQCCICSELFVEATTLNCSHTYCLKCIRDWMLKTKKNAECPICRTVITTHVKSCVLDSFIDRVIDSFSPEQKERRKQLIKERSATPKKPRKRSAEHFSYWVQPRSRRHSEFLASGLLGYDPIVLQDSD